MTDAFLAVLLVDDKELTSPEPLALLDASAPDLINGCRELARQLLARQLPRENWSARSELVLTGIIAFCCACGKNPEDKSLKTVRLIVGDRRKLDDAFAAMERYIDIPAIAELGTWYTSNYGKY